MANLYSRGRKVYAILVNDESGEGKEIIRKAPSVSEEQLKKMLDNFFKKNFNTLYDKEDSNIKNETINRLSNSSLIYNLKDEEVKEAKKNLKNVTGSDEISMDNIKKFIRVSLSEQTRIKKYMDTSLIDRNHLRKQWILEETQKQIDERDIKSDKIAMISLGNAGSGKTSAGGKLFLNQFGAIEVDADIFKNYIPEFIDNPNSIGAVHKESSNITADFLESRIKEGNNLFIPKVGGEFDKIKKLVDELKQNGYKVYMNFVDLDLKENIIRTITRGLTTGRFTNEEVIKLGYWKNLGVFEMMKEYVDGWAMYDNNKKPKIVEGENWIL